MRFWDSSAVVPLLIRQAASPRVDRWWAQDPRVALWTFTPVEITSALWRQVREGTMNESDAQVAESRAQEFADASHTVADVEGVKSLARRLLRVHPLRAADALQLGAALVWAAGRSQGKALVTLDERLALAARREGFEVP
ncbi:MAG: type II toxin-antitoxin system VapC family toxin [Gemmatimonadaceae bacterium]